MYAYPPICHIPKVLQHMRRFNCPVIHFDNATLAQKTLVHRSTPTCNRNTKNTTKIQNLLKQPNTDIKHPNLETLLLTAKFLLSEVSKKRVFLNTKALLTVQQAVQAHRQIMHANSDTKFDSWCSAREIDPYLASLSDLYTKVFNIGPKGV